MTNNKYSRFGKNIILIFWGSVGSKLLSFVMFPFYTHWLSKADYGTFDMIQVYALFFTGLITCCITESIFVFPKGRPFLGQSRYYTSGIVFSLATFCLAAVLFYLATVLFRSHGLDNIFSDYSFVIFTIILVTFLQTYNQQFARSVDKMNVYVISGVILIASIALFSLLLIPEFGLQGYIWSQVIAHLVVTLYIVIHGRFYRYFNLRLFSMPRVRSMLAYSIPLIPNTIMWWLINALNRPLIETKVGLDALGIFAVSGKFPALMTMIFTAFTFSWQISVLEEFRKPGYQIFYNRILKLIFTILTVTSLFLCMFSETLTRVIASEAFIESWKFVPLLSLGVFFSCLAGFIGVNFLATKESKYFFYSSVWAAAVSVLFNFLLIPRYGLLGACVSIIASQFVMMFIRILCSWKYAKITQLSYYIVSIGLNLLLIVCVLSFTNNLYKWIAFLVSFGIVSYMSQGSAAEVWQFASGILRKTFKKS